MKKIFFLLMLGAMVSCSNGAKESATEQALANGTLVGNYGAEIDAKGVSSTDEMMSMLKDADEVFVKVDAEITATCAAKGCWMNLQLGDGEEMRVTFKDYGFFVPTEGMEGNRAVIEGKVSRTLTDVATLKHFAEDAGKPQVEIDAIVEPKKEYTFEATGVIIYNEEVSE